MARRRRIVVVALALAGLAAVPTAGTGSGRAPTARVLFAAGDIASCGSEGDEITARLVAARRGTVATLGDTVYEAGTTGEFRNCYAPSWGRFKRRTRPSLGNHDYGTSGAAGYFGYFGRAAGPAGQGWYAYELGSWRVIVLNSNCAQVGGCEEGTPQARWLRAELASRRRLCTLAYWHHPRFSSGRHGSDLTVAPFWRILYRAGADVVLSGHDHSYERFAPQTPEGRLDRRRGIRQFVVGTGGRSHYAFGGRVANSTARSSGAFGVLQLTLRAGRYDWRFLAEPRKRFSDAGSTRCH